MPEVRGSRELSRCDQRLPGLSGRFSYLCRPANGHEFVVSLQAVPSNCSVTQLSMEATLCPVRQILYALRKNSYKGAGKRMRITGYPASPHVAFIRHSEERWDCRHNWHSPACHGLCQGKAASLIMTAQYEIVGAVVEVLHFEVRHIS